MGGSGHRLATLIIVGLRQAIFNEYGSRVGSGAPPGDTCNGPRPAPMRAQQALPADDEAAQDRENDEHDGDPDRELEQGLLEPPPRSLDGIRSTTEGAAERRSLGLEEDDGDEDDRDDDRHQVEGYFHRMSVSLAVDC